VPTTTNTTHEDRPRLTSSPPDAAFWGLCGPDVTTPAEVPPPVSVGSDRFIKRIERLRRDDDGLTRVSREALGLLERLHPDGDTDDLRELALLLEASAGSTDQFLRSVHNPEVLPTDHGDLFVLDYLAFTPMLSRDIANPRPFLRLGTRTVGQDYAYTPPVLDEHDAHDFRTLEVMNVAHFDDLHRAHRNALGFVGQVRDARDRLDLERGARLGILKPATVAPVRVVDHETGATCLYLALIDANRRLTLVQRLFEAVMPNLGFGTFARRHLFDGASTAFRRFTPDDAHDVRELLADAFHDLDAPGDTGDADADQQRLAQWARSIDDNKPEQAALLRTRVMRCRVAIGLDPASALASTNPVTVALGAYRDQLHLPELADVKWDTRATEAMVAHDLLRRSREYASVVPTAVAAPGGQPADWQTAVLFDPTGIDWHVPGLRSTHRPDVAAEATDAPVDDVEECAPGIAALRPGLAPALADDAEAERPLNVLDVILATIATVVCRNQPMTPIISEVLAHHRMANSPKARGQLAAALLGPLLRLPADGSDTARAYAALSRTAQHSIVYKLDESVDPLGEDVRWVNLIGTAWLEVVDRAARERAVAASAGGDRVVGPAQLLLALAAAVSMEVSPEVISGERGPSLYQLTLSGLGGQRGHYKGDPLAVLLPLTTSEDGLAQLWELIVAAIADPTPRVARSIRWDPNLYDERIYGPFLAEVDVRDKPWGHGPGTPSGSGSGAGGSGATTRLGAASFVQDVFERIAAALDAHADEVAPVVDHANRTAVDPELDPDVDDFGGRPAEAFFRDGIDSEVADRIAHASTALQQAAYQGKIVRQTAGGSGS
jgi:hypothetical protein